MLTVDSIRTSRADNISLFTIQYSKLNSSFAKTWADATHVLRVMARDALHQLQQTTLPAAGRLKTQSMQSIDAPRKPRQPRSDAAKQSRLRCSYTNDVRANPSQGAPQPPQGYEVPEGIDLALDGKGNHFCPLRLCIL